MRGISLFSFRKRANECLISEKRVFTHFGRENRRDFADQLSDDNADRLSYLLEAVVFVILSYLSLKECIATSFLSRNWRALWTGMHCLNFDDAIIPRRRLHI